MGQRMESDRQARAGSDQGQSKLHGQYDTTDDFTCETRWEWIKEQRVVMGGAQRYCRYPMYPDRFRPTACLAVLERPARAPGELAFQTMNQPS